MPVRYAPMIAPSPKEFIAPIPDDYFIWWLFRGRCIVCHQPADDINEIELRSHGKHAVKDWTNRVTLCRNHHTGQDGYHKHGVNEKSREKMRQLRYDFLMANGREEYANYVPLAVNEFGSSPLENTIDVFMKEQAIKIASVFGVSKELLK